MINAPILDLLRVVPALEDLSEDDLAWLVAHGEEVTLQEGEPIFQEGDPADAMHIFLEGGARFRRESLGPSARTFTASVGSIGGTLPYSRMTHYNGTSRATAPSRVLKISVERFPEMLQKIPLLGQRLVGLMSDRIRESTRADQEREKLISLGKLSAGLAHELNNPAAAVRSSAKTLRETFGKLREAYAALEALSLAGEQRLAIFDLEKRVFEKTSSASPLNVLTRSDREEEIADWLESRSIANAWDHAATFVEAGLDKDFLYGVAKHIPDMALEPTLTGLSAQLLVWQLLDEVESGAARISDLIKAIKEYSFMNQSPIQEVDIHAGLESTLKIMGHRLKSGVTVVRRYASELPSVEAYGAELNQVWTNLIDNALDALDGRGTLVIRTVRELDRILVEIADTGPGVPPEIQSRIFEPFFTTKEVGRGTGLGLDVAYNIIRRHQGDIWVESQPGDTRFQVRLPFNQRANA